MQDPLFEDFGQRGGRASGAFELTGPGHVPSEPLQFATYFCYTVRPFRGLFWPCIVTDSTVPDLGFDCTCPEEQIGKLAVSVRQPLWLQGRCSYGDFWIVSWRTDLGIWIVHSSGPRFLLQCLVVFSPCLYDGLLSTSRSWAGLRSVPGEEAPVRNCLSWFFFTVGEYGDEVSTFTGNLLSCGAHSTTPLHHIGEVGPFRLAGFDLTLQRQNLLPVVFDLSDDCLAILSWPCSLNFATEHLLVTESRTADNEDVVMPFVDQGIFMPSPLPGCGERHEGHCLMQRRTDLESLLAFLVGRLHSLFTELLEIAGVRLVEVCRTWCVIFLCYLCRLLLFGLSLKGGVNNCDNLLRCGRATVAAAPWQLGCSVNNFSPRLQRLPTDFRRKRKLMTGYSTDLFLFLLLASALVSPAGAANCRSSFAFPTAFPRPPAHTGQENTALGLLQDPNVAQDPDPPPWVLNPPQVAFITRAYKLFGYGHQPEYVSCTTTRTATAQRCLHLLEPGLGVARTGGSGALHFLRGPAVVDELQAQWMPDWIHSALGRLVVIDPSLMGFPPFQAYIQDGIVSYARIHRLMPELEGCEYYIFVPAQSADPLAYEGYPSRMIIDHCDVIHLVPEPTPPHTVQDTQWAFDHFETWSLTEFADGYDEPLGTQRLMVLSELENFVIEAVEGESDAALVQRICRELNIPSDEASLVRPDVPFERPMYCQHCLIDVVYLLDVPLGEHELVVFVDARPVLQTFSAIRLHHPVIPVEEAIGLFRLRVEAIEGYRLWLKGGRRRQDCLVAEHRGVFSVRLEAEGIEYTSDSSSGSEDASDDSSDDDEHGPDAATPCNGDAGDAVRPVDTRVSPSPADATGPHAPQGDVIPPGSAISSQLARAIQGMQPLDKWNRAFSRDAFVQGQHGDTSVEFAVRKTCRCSPQARTSLSAFKPGSATLCRKFWVTGLVFFAQIMRLQAVVGVENCPIQDCDFGWPGLACDLTLSDPTGASAWTIPSDGDAQGTLHVGRLVTLLEEAKDEGHSVVCQFASDFLESAWTSPAPRTPAPQAAPPIISLDAAIPCTVFQATVKDLQGLLPDRCGCDLFSWQDWLDCDLHAVYSECKSCPVIWEWLSVYGSWYDDVFMPDAIHIYTDGSACQMANGHCTPASWAFNVWAVTATKQAYLGHAFGVTASEQSIFHLGEVQDDALTGEQLALAWALCWTMEASCAFQAATFVFHFDCATAGHDGFGGFKLPSATATSRPTCLSRSVAILRQCAQSVCTLIGRHIPSHSGFAGNELADILAKYAGRCPEPDEIVNRPSWPSRLVKHELAEWAWMALGSHHDLPALGALEAEAGRLFAEAAVRPFTFYASNCADDGFSKTVSGDIGVQLRLCTLNALSLRDWDDMPQGLALTGKRALLKSQFLRSRLHVVALQETRIKEDCIQPDADFFMLHSSCDLHGCFGCALWLSKTMPVVFSQQQTYYFTKEACTVLIAEPRLLIVQVDLPGFMLTLVSAHAPYDGHRSQSPADFWDHVGRVVATRPSGAQLVVLTDSNGHLGSVSSSAVGAAGTEFENPAGAAFHTFLLEFGLCLPSTFQELHDGLHLTWRVGSSLGHRLDYIAVPEDWLTGTVASSVWYDFEHVHDVDDHVPVLLSCELARMAECKHRGVTGQAPRPRADSDPGQLQCFQYAIGTLPPVGWHVDVDMHYATFVKSTLWCWKECVEPTPRRRSKPFVSTETLAAIGHRKQVRSFLAEEDKALGHVRKLIGVFAFWLQRHRVEPTLHQTQHLADLLRRGRLSVASAIGCLGRLRLALRKGIRADRAAFLKKLADEVAETTLHQPKQLFEAVYKAFPVVRSKRRGGFCPLPAVLLADGRRAGNVEERLQRWTEHFACQEGGRIVLAAGYDQAVQDQAPDPATAPLFDIGCVPTLLDVEQDMHRLRKGKAAGPDMITADLLKLDVPGNSRRLLPIFAKAAVSCREPIVFKGGCLITLAKKAYASLNCADFRSIILSSVPGKLLHRSLRKRLLPPLQDVALPLQSGALPGASPELLALYLTAFQRWAQSTGQRWAVTFFDVKQAYYRTLRQLVVDCDSDEGLCRVLYDLGLPPQALCELKQMLQRVAMTSPFAGQSHLTALLRDLLTATWFKFEASLMVAVTHKGTRPGDPAADVLFAFTLSALFHAINSELEKRGLVDVLPPVQGTPLVHGYPEAACLQFVSWADDFARPFVGDSPTFLLDVVERATKCCTERASACGIELTFGRDKTAFVCDTVTAQHLRKVALVSSVSGIHFRDDTACRDCFLPVVHAYKHLGGVFNTTSKPDLEIFLRRASALGPLRPVRSRLFANREVPLATRRTLLYSLGLSRFIHGAGALHLDQKGHQRMWHAAYIDIWAHLIPRRPDGKPHSYMVLFVSKAPPPHLFLALQRAAILAKLVSARFVTILHMLQLEWEVAQGRSWLSQLDGDIQAVALWVRTAENLRHCSCPLHTICQQLEGSSTWWTANIRQAVKAFAADVVKWRARPKVIDIPDGGSFQCHICCDTFSRRSSLTVHLARKHQLFAPARHFASGGQCIACLKTFSTVMLAQAHLRRSRVCLQRAVWLMEPLHILDVLEIERADKLVSKKIQHGAWQQQATVAKAQQGSGPKNVTAVDVEADPENFSLTTVANQFWPSLENVQWIQTYLDEASTTGPRQKAVSWWFSKPTDMNS